MPTHFRNLASHRLSVLSLYRTLIRHATHVDQIALPDNAFLPHIKRHFKRQKHQMSPTIVCRELERAYDIEEKIRLLYFEPSQELLEEIIDLVPKIPKREESKLLNKHGQPIKYDYKSAQPLDQQRRTNYLNKYVRLKQKDGLLPLKIDPLMKPLLMDEALHERAKLDIERAQRRQDRGPYQIKAAYSSSVKFLRFPWKQDPAISKKILDQVKREQDATDMTQYYHTNRWLYEMENQWEKRLGGESDWGDSVKETIRTLDKEIHSNEAHFSKYANTKLPLIKAMKQIEVDKIHQRAGERLENLKLESTGVTAFEKMLGKDTLFDLVEKHKFSSCNHNKRPEP